MIHGRKCWMKGTRHHQNKGYGIRSKRIRERSNDKAYMHTMKNGEM
jgi:hypothetical protein